MRARRAGRAMEWSPPSVSSLGRGQFGWPSLATNAGRREPSSRNAADIWARARALSKGVMGMSPQSRIFRGVVYGFRPRRGLKPRMEVCREEAWRIARGPKRAPGWRGIVVTSWSFELPEGE